MWNWLKTLYHRLGSPKWFYQITGKWLPWFAVSSVLFLAVGLVMGLAYAPMDYQQGNSFRIMYVHVPAAFLAQSVYMMMAAAGVVMLVWKIKMADVVAQALAPIGAVMTFISLVTGAIWGMPTWGTWWMWDARLTSMLILFFLYLGVIALREALSPQEVAAKACALLAIVGVINIPIIKYSVDWWYTLHQPASIKLTEKPSMPASMYLPLLFMVLGFYALLGWSVLLRARSEVLRREAKSGWVRELLKDK
ncbi:MAG TPA: heme ABC transporter permease [Marinospirillum sp.]|uniref:heme ABC transporter permease n=1 Tax=Marinospirillum sp. TaxID=2183934 RepID=UPI002B47884E|nr:heme ABC transporter permease [Marinospirillum sp.]HKM16411.1 heme ABC transporter permease [Marinospirillum sp.]